VLIHPRRNLQTYVQAYGKFDEFLRLKELLPAIPNAATTLVQFFVADVALRHFRVENVGQISRVARCRGGRSPGFGRPQLASAAHDF
jgi:hypothetical protein